MRLKELLNAQGATGHAEVDRVVNLLAEEDFDVLELDKLSNVFVVHVARHMADGAQEDAMVICPDLSNPDAGYIMRDGGKGDVVPPRVPLHSYGRAPS